ncbi:MAG: hypothetical protein J0H82_03245 [Alphaproteobacteria bacterium]|jgi:hypothetical protein|nr:hypothetical protein [Alphaproteobacteria bacterium]
MTSTLLSTLARAMFPLDGAIPELVPGIVAAIDGIAPRALARFGFVDLTAGSCLMPLYYGARGAGRLVVNDAAERTAVAARALWGGVSLDWTTVERLVTTPAPRLRPHVPSFHFACDYLLEPAADVFDRLYFAEVPARAAPAYRYLALLWAQGFAMDDDQKFPVLMTHDPAQIAELDGGWWDAYIARAAAPLEALAPVVARINEAMGLQRPGSVEVHCEDLATLVGRLALDRDCVVAVNPPTNGIDEYVVDDQIVHSLLANRMIPLTRSRETPAAFWEARVRAALQALPRGAHALVFGGDGAMTLNACRKVWQAYGPIVHEHPLRRRRRDAAWALVRRG